MSALHYSSHFNWSAKSGPLILGFGNQSNRFTLIYVWGIENYVSNKAEREFDSGSFDHTTSLSTLKNMLYNSPLSEATQREAYIFFFFFVIKLEFQSEREHNIILTKMHKIFCIHSSTE